MSRYPLGFCIGEKGRERPGAQLVCRLARHEAEIEKVLLFISDNGAEASKRLGICELQITSIRHAAVDGLEDPMNGFFKDFDLVVLDDSGGSTNLTDTLRRIRTASDIPVICVSSRKGATECVVAFELGADDYVREPVDKLEFAARVRRLMRKPNLTGATKASQVLVAEDLELHVGERIVFRSGGTVHLTRVEFDLLHLLLKSRGTLVTRETISREVFASRSKIRNRSIDVHMSGLRKKLGRRPNGGERIRTIRGAGYIYSTGIG